MEIIEVLKSFVLSFFDWTRPHLSVILPLIVISWVCITAIHRIIGKKMPRPVRAVIPILISAIWYASKHTGAMTPDGWGEAIGRGAAATSIYEIGMKYLIEWAQAKGKNLIRKEKE